ncbi:MAG TPA: insulinase family protein, partial [Candidatus Berkiella sp.]|nr:insulinase family protein [Candidatus Berkiella sp.]
YVAKNVAVTIVGDLTSTEADSIAQTLVKDMVLGEKPTAIPQVTNLQQNVVKKVNFPSAQTHILLGEPGVKHGDPEYYALYLGNHILGGNGSVTRIFDIIRNKNGLAYSAYSYFVPMRERGPFVLGCQTRNDQADKALQLMQGLLHDFVEKGPTDAEIEQAKKNLLGG